MTEEISKVIADVLKDYKPEPIKDGFELMKANFNCGVDYCRIEEFNSRQFLRYALIVVDDASFTGRKLWGSMALDNENQIKKIANIFFAVTNNTFKNLEELEGLLDEFASKTLKVSAYPGKQFKKEGEDWVETGEKVQRHSIKGLAKEKAATEAAPF